MESKSKLGKLDTTDLKNLGKTSLLVGAAAALTYFAQHLTGIDLGENSTILVSLLTVVVDGLVKLLKDNTKE